jgi:HNH endonuclease
METITKTCPVCDTRYTADSTRLKHGRQTTCSRKCSYTMRAERRSKSIDLICANCGCAFEKCPSHIKGKHGASFCSSACHYAGRTKGFTKRVVIRPYVYTPEDKAAQLAASRSPKGKRVHHWLTCSKCGKSFDDPRLGRARKSGLSFCSLECCNSYRVGENNPSWLGGHPHYYGRRWRSLRRSAWARDNETCRRCGLHRKRKPDVHHIKPVSQFENIDDAHTLDNVVCLCQKCHHFCEHHGIDFAL